MRMHVWWCMAGCGIGTYTIKSHLPMYALIALAQAFFFQFCCMHCNVMSI